MMQCKLWSPADASNSFAASATFLRSLAGFGFPLFANSLYDSLTLGGGNTLLAGIVVVIGVPAPFLLWQVDLSMS